MILLFAPALLQTDPERSRALAFLVAASSIKDGAPIAASPLGKAPLDDEKEMDGFRVYRSGDSTVWIDPRTGLVHQYSGGDHSIERPRPERPADGRFSLGLVPRKVSDAEAKTLARRYFAATGRTYEIDFTAVEDLTGANRDSITLNYVPTFRGVRYPVQYGGLVLVDRETGGLTYLSASGLTPPAPPRSVVPAVSPEAARLAALRAVVRTSGGLAIQSPQLAFELNIAVLDPRKGRDVVSFMAPADVAVAQAGKSRLVYLARFLDSRYGFDAEGIPQMLYFATVDAVDGRVLRVSREDPGMMGGGQAAPKPFLLPTGSRPWRVAGGQGGWSRPAQATLAPTPAPGFAPTGRLLITDGGTALQVAYDAKHNIVSVGGRAYRPGPALASLLRKRLKT